jgi:hypothetical protein
MRFGTMASSFDKDAFKESFGDTILATIINFPLILTINYISLEVFELKALALSIVNTSILFSIAVTRKYCVRVYFKNKELLKKRKNAVH